MMEKNLREVTVKPKRQRYRRKGNPAVELMRKVIAAKGNHDLHSNDFMRYNRYQRMTFAFNNITQEMADSFKLLQRPLLKRHIEYCPQTEKYILPFAYNEAASMHLYRRNPKLERNYTLGTNEEGIADLMPNGDVMNTVLRSVFTDVNIYDNTINLLERQFTSPLSSRAAISFFQFFIQDTTIVDNQRVIIVNFVPQNPQDFGFSGRLNILDDSTYRVQQCVLNLPLRSSVNFVNNLVLQQKFTDLPNGQRVLYNDDLFAEIGILKRHRTFMLHRATTYTNFSTDSIPPVMFMPSEHLREGTTQTRDTTFWNTHRTDTLSLSESRLHETMEEMQSNPRNQIPLYILRTVVGNYAETSLRNNKSKFDIGPVMTMVSHNFIDGFRYRFGGQTTANFHPQLFLKGYVAYGSQSHRWYGMGEVEWSFLRKQYSSVEYPRHSVMFQWRDEVTSPSDMMWQSGRDKDNVWVSMRWQTVDHMMFMRSWLARYEVETNQHLGIKIDLRNSRITPTGSLVYKRLNGEAIEHITTTDIVTSLRWAPGEEVVNSRQRRHVIHHNNPVFTLAHTIGLQGLFGADYHYNLTEIGVFRRFWLNSYGRIDCQLRGGLQWNRVPFQMLIMPVANQSYIITRNMFSLVGNMEFINDRYASFDMEWDLSGKLLNRVPLIKYLKLREIIGFKSLYGHLSSRNDPSQNLGDEYLFEMPSRDGESIVHSMGNTPYMEFYVGLHNIFKIMRIDYVRRLNYLDYPGVNKHGFRFCLEFDF
ncbi:MAG: carboxypeptidase-like regulatory domain-containing protein [Bacteroidaceae bacterium]|nr:carboxypeptidase-like regulatory domain-containing protein [Bacteroidaceae bacterium]